jgi:hypothetical protein
VRKASSAMLFRAKFPEKMHDIITNDIVGEFYPTAV